MMLFRRIAQAFVAVLFAAILVEAVSQAPDLERLGPQVGERVTDFSLPDQHGQTRTLRSMLGPNGAILVFFRSADW